MPTPRTLNLSRGDSQQGFCLALMSLLVWVLLLCCFDLTQADVLDTQAKLSLFITCKRITNDTMGKEIS